MPCLPPAPSPRRQQEHASTQDFIYIFCPPSIPRGRTLRARDREVVVVLVSCSVPWQIYNNMQVHGHFYPHSHIPTYSVTYTRHTHTTLLENRTGIGRQEYPKENSTVPPHSRQRVSEENSSHLSRKGWLVNKEYPKDSE